MQRPCSAVMRKITVVPPKESGNPAYIMIGDSLQFESSFLSSS